MTVLSRYNFNLTLTDLSSRRHTRILRNGRELRSSCPVCGGDNPTELRADLDSGWWRCFKCAARGRLQDSRYRDEQAVRPIAAERVRERPSTYPIRSAAVPRLVEPSGDLDTIGRQLQELQPQTPAAAYLQSRGIPLEIARVCGVRFREGWLEDNGGPFGRIVFPLTNPEGTLLNYYGRAIPGIRELPKTYWHRYGRGDKGYWNGGSLRTAREIWLTEGAFNALSLYAAGILMPGDPDRSAISMGGAGDFRPEWFRGVRKIICCFDRDAAGERACSEVAAWVLRNSAAAYNLAPLLAPYNDANEYLAANGPGALVRLAQTLVNPAT